MLNFVKMIILGRYKQCIQVNWAIKNHIDQNCMCVTTIFSNSVCVSTFLSHAMRIMGTHVFTSVYNSPLSYGGMDISTLKMD